MNHESFIRHLSENAAIEVLTSRGLPVMTCAGLNTTTGAFSVNIENLKGTDINGKPLEQEASEPGSIGKALPGVAVKIVDPNEHSVELANDEIGVLMVSGSCVVQLEMVIENHGWLITGWSARMNSKGFIFLSPKS